MSAISDLIEAGADKRAGYWGKTIAIIDLAGVTHNINGAVFYSTNVMDPVTGGYYNETTAGAEFKTSALTGGFVPLPEMIAKVDGVTMRIAPDGVTPGQFLYRLRFVSKTAPSRPV